MSVKWLNDNFCSLGDDKVRVELGPQIIELECSDTNLSNKVTAPHYKMGAIDALGNFIRPDEVIAKTSDKAKKAAMQAYVDYEVKTHGRGIIKKGQKMNCVDWRSKHVPKLWKVYKEQEFEEFNHKTKEMETLSGFVKVAEFEDKDKALTHARGLV